MFGSCLSWKGYLGAVLQTGYRKSLIFYLRSSLIGEMNRRSAAVKNPVISVIYQLNLLINDQLQKTNRVRQRAVVLNVKHGSHEQERSLDLSLDFRNVDVSGLKKGGNDSLPIELSSELGLVASPIQFKCTKYFHDDLINACL